jgi:hypothetical protein
MLPLEVFGLGSSLSVLLLIHHNGKMQVEDSSILAVSNGDGGRQLQLDDSGTCPLALGTVGGGSGMVDTVFVWCGIFKYVICTFVYLAFHDISLFS